MADSATTKGSNFGYGGGKKIAARCSTQITWPLPPRPAYDMTRNPRLADSRSE